MKKITKKISTSVQRLETGIKNLDEILHGGLPKGSVVVLGGSPGAGKTTMVQQLCFHNATKESPVLYFQTLSEPTIKTIKYLNEFDYFQPEKVGSSVFFYDLGKIMRGHGLKDAKEMLLNEIKKIRPSIVVIDSFKAFQDLSTSPEELRKFAYEVAISLVAWECTAILIGEYTSRELEISPLSSIVDGIILMSNQDQFKERQRVIEIVKLRGTDHERGLFTFSILKDGIHIHTPELLVKRAAKELSTKPLSKRVSLGVPHLDVLIPGKVPAGSNLLISGSTGTGKTTFILEALYRGAKDQGEKGLLFTFEESVDCLKETAKALGWNLEAQIKKGLLEIVQINQMDIQIDAHLQFMMEKIIQFKAHRVAVDSLSIFFNRIDDSKIVRSKLFQLSSIIKRTGALGFFVTDIPVGSNQISRFGVEENVVDGVILLKASLKNSIKTRSLEVYKLRNSVYDNNEYEMTIQKGIVLKKIMSSDG